MAIVVIHGIGEQKPFETLDNFVKKFEEIYSEKFGVSKIEHNLIWFDKWGESCVSLVSENQQIDILEYYWSHMTQRKITAAQVTDWIFQVARGAKSHYQKKENRDASNYRYNSEIFKEDGEIKFCAYAAQMVSMAGYFKYIKPVFWLMEAQPAFKNIVQRLLNLVKSQLSRALVNFIGDITLYCTADVKSEYYNTRTQILTSAADKVISLAMKKEHNAILLCGHSLGSVIVYDVVDRMNRQMQNNIALRAEKDRFIGIVTFGSPLDKVAFFFDEYINSKKQPIRYAAVSFLHGFRRKGFENPMKIEFTNEKNETKTIEIHTGLKEYLSKIPWLNFWMPTDIISGRLDAYRDVENLNLSKPKDIDAFLKGEELAADKPSKVIQSRVWRKTQAFLTSHNTYWQRREMYDCIIKQFILKWSNESK